MSVFDVFKIGIGPSSSHTLGPMLAARRFVLELQAEDRLSAVTAVTVELFGSLAMTGKGHGTHRGILLGLLGKTPETIDPALIDGLLGDVTASGRLALLEHHEILFQPERDLIFRRGQSLPYHPNGMRFRARFDGERADDPETTTVFHRLFYSVGGGFVVDDQEAAQDNLPMSEVSCPLPIISAGGLLATCKEQQLSVAQVMRQNELACMSAGELSRRLRAIVDTMLRCVARGLQTDGRLPGGLNVPRRAPGLYRKLLAEQGDGKPDPLTAMDWVNVYAMSVNEENAAGSQVVTAPTNGAAGIIPAVLQYYRTFYPDANDAQCEDYLLTAGAIGLLYIKNASISGAEVGCQGEVGVACSMAAAGLTAVLGGNPLQVEQAAEIGMEHNLGLTCDPVGGLVQIPCIERNAMGAVKAINAARLALAGNGAHHVSLDQVMATMKQTGADMQNKYKETSEGGLAVNVTEC